ncbi:MAG: ACP S-malonyltransferase [Rhodocyclaceae bacterium]|nr:ACP S-malonyltransferase [Rhodocyclaceae bacterium]
MSAEAANARTPAGRLAVVFPGQGSQSAGMGRPLLAAWPGARERLREFSAWVDHDIEALLCGDEAAADAVSVHLATVAFGLLAWEGLARAGAIDGREQPKLLAGHSLGEITALACSGMLDAEDALRLALARGRAIARCCAAFPGGMRALIGAPVDEMRAAVADWIERSGHGDRLWVANVNAPRQLVVAGLDEALAALAPAMRARGVSVAALATAGAFHTPLMNDAAREVAAFAAGLTVRLARIPLLSSMSGRVLADTPDLSAHLALQVVSPVRWLAVMRALQRAGISGLIEAGPPGNVLLQLAAACHDWPATKTPLADCFGGQPPG